MAGRHPCARRLRPRRRIDRGRTALHRRARPAARATQSGATLRELMARLGHSRPRAALIYQHATGERDKRIADGLNLMIEGRLIVPPLRARKSHQEHVQRPDPARARKGLTTTEGHRSRECRLTWVFVVGAGDGNRTRVVVAQSPISAARPPTWWWIRPAYAACRLHSLRCWLSLWSAGAAQGSSSCPDPPDTWRGLCNGLVQGR